MWPDGDFDERISGLAAFRPGIPLSRQAQDLPVACARRYGDIERRAIRQRDTGCGAIDGIEEVDFQAITPVVPAPAKFPAATAGKKGRKNLLGTHKIGKPGCAFIALRTSVLLGEVAIIMPLRLLGSR